MDRLKTLSNKVNSLYNSKLKTRDVWADWLYPNHVLIVKDFTRELAQRYDAKVELAQAAALLHDIADYKMARDDPGHEDESLRLAEKIMKDCGYDSDAIETVVNDAIRFHSCSKGQRPKTTEGLILAAADSMAHLKSDFYLYAVWAKASEQSLEDSKAWTLAKIERDFNDKINFDDLREELRQDYETIKTLFSR